jgi:hypothetical protein
MDLLIFALVVLLIVGVVSAIAYQIPFPPPLGWMRWAIPVLALIVALILLLERVGMVH